MKWIVAVLSACLLLAAGCAKKTPASLEVTHQVEGHNVRLQIKATGPKMWTDTHPHLRVDEGVEVMIYGPVYIVRDLTPGSHQIRVYLADADHVPMGIEETIQVEIPQ